MASAQLPVIFHGKYSVLFLGYADCFTEAYRLSKQACVKNNMIFKKSHTRCLSSSKVHLCVGKTKTEFPCWIHEPQLAKPKATSTKASKTLVLKQKPKQKKGK